MAFKGAEPDQQALFPDSLTKRVALPVLDDQTDIRYFGTVAKTILNRPEATGMPFWSINPYIGCALGCAYCYARYAHGYAFERAAMSNPDRADVNRDYREMVPWLAFERRILVKENAATTLRKTLRQGSDRHAALIKGETISIGTATDPYQPAERRFRITRSILEVLAEHPGLRIRIITKSPLITRDVDVMRRVLRHSSIHVHMSLISVDRDLARRIEPRAPTPESSAPRHQAPPRLGDRRRRERHADSSRDHRRPGATRRPRPRDCRDGRDARVRVRAATPGGGAEEISAVHFRRVSASRGAISGDVRE